MWQKNSLVEFQDLTITKFYFTLKQEGYLKIVQQLSAMNDDLDLYLT